MGDLSSEMAWFFLAVLAVLGGTVLCKYNRSPGLVQGAVCLAGLWGGVYLLNLSLFCGLILSSLTCFLVYTYLSGQEFLPADQKAVLVTGSDSGIGHSLCKYLDKLGFTVFAGVLDEKGAGAGELRRTCSPRLLVLQLDITNPEQIKDALGKVAEKVQDTGLWAVINNAGILGFPCDGELIPMSEYRRCMAVNFFGAVEVTKAFLPLLRKSKGRLVNMSSMAGGVPFDHLAAYSSSKAALTMFSSILRRELSEWGVKVAVIQPGGFRTSIAGNSDTWDKLEKDLLDHLPAEVQEDYGREYIHSQRSFLHMINTQSSPDFSPVLRDIEHAISAKRPSAFYAPGEGCYLWLCLASFLPAIIFDYISKKLLGAGKRLPRALSVPTWKDKAT
ncbi:PREDICTED: estradiol 17-beta-dehydrogenase 2 [Propithecus coquereli]|uniref:Hydroxysteroid 17-beta dehydrogenase 2 n=1 Tax=Propithecus coquereli TaxID=379532 RepID=A0A2K6F4R4_PROCO|nr:PREDICTED: estradiol 17-beta-dehydrogenase 2 [Propithecus coquereli]